MNQEKLSKLTESVRIGGKGTPRRKTKKVHKSTGADDKKLTAALKKLNPQNIPSIEEVNMFRSDGSSLLHFDSPKVQAALGSNTFVISGSPQEKDVVEMLPSILGQLGQSSIASLRKIAENFQNNDETATGKTAAAAADDDDIPDLVQDFEAEAV